MKLVIAVIAFSLLSTQMALAACQDDSMATAARKLRLSGQTSLVEKKLDGQETETQMDTVKSVSSRTEEYKTIKSMVEDKNNELLSKMFGFENDGSIVVVARNNSTCEIAIFGTDGEELSSLKIVDGSIKSNSISFYQANMKFITTITKVKKSKILSK